MKKREKIRKGGMKAGREINKITKKKKHLKCLSAEILRSKSRPRSRPRSKSKAVREKRRKRKEKGRKEKRIKIYVYHVRRKG